MKHVYTYRTRELLRLVGMFCLETADAAQRAIETFAWVGVRLEPYYAGLTELRDRGPHSFWEDEDEPV